MPQRKRGHPQPDAGSASRPTSGASFRPGRPLPERTAPALTREAPWIAFNASTVPQNAEGPGFGPNRFVLGANVPWVQYGLDFGMSPGRPEGGVHAHPEEAALFRQAGALDHQHGRRGVPAGFDQAGGDGGRARPRT